jgi:hypothetical protein
MSAAVDPAQAPIFIVGTGRSGTTLLRFMLSAHPRIYITHEASFYLWERLFPRRAPRRAFLEYYFQTMNYRWLRLDPRLVTEGLPDPLPRERIGEAYANLMRAKAAQYGRVRFGDKTPSHAECLKRIFEDFPGARVIHIVRDPRGVALSLSRMPWAGASLYGNAGFCERERRQVAPYRHRILTIRLEDLLADGRATMGRVLEHVGEPWDDAVLDHPRHIPDPHDMPPFPWLESSAGARGEKGVKWREALSPVEIRMIERQARRVMAEHGYPPAPLDREPGGLAVWWRGVRELPQRLHVLGTYAHLAWLARDPRNFDTPSSRALWRRLNPSAWRHYPDFVLPTAPRLPGEERLLAA